MRWRDGLLVGAVGMAWSAVASAQPAPDLAKPPSSVSGDRLDVASPNGAVRVELSRLADGAPALSLSFNGQPVLAPSRLGVAFAPSAEDQTADALRLSAGVALVASVRRQGVDDYRPVAGKTAHVHDAYAELTIAYRETSGLHRWMEVIVRAYDDGAAFRYRLPPPSAGGGEAVIAGELTRLAFPADYSCYGLNLGQYENSHEGEFDPIPASRIRSHDLYDAPLVCRTGQGATTLVLTEADVRDYPGAYFSGAQDGGLGVEVALTPRWGETGVAVRRPWSKDGVLTPWRVAMVADRPAGLIESNLVDDLSPPSAIGDTGWITPGKASWDWWSGWRPPGAQASDTATLEAYIDFAGRFGLPYAMIDEGWSWNSSTDASIRPGADIARAAPGLDIPALVAYAAQRKVGLFVWVNWRLMDRDMDRALAQYERWGLKGIKVDFINRQDQQAVAFYHRLLAAAAAHHLLVDLHGAYAPRGLERTYPNFLTQEGVMGAEYNKWSTRITATHNVTLPFTRMLLGPADYTPGGFRNVAPADFVARDVLPEVQTTRGQQLAMYVVYQSGFGVLADAPVAYEGPNASGADFLRIVPTSWDETRALSGDIGQWVALARRKGREWYVGAMTNEQGRTLDVPLAFLPKGRWQAEVWRDGDRPDAVVRQTLDLDTRAGAATPLRLTLAPSGGAVVRLVPAT